MPPSDNKKRSERQALGNYIDRHGDKMAPCTRCEKFLDLAGRPRRCVAIQGDQYSRCSACARQGKSCDYRERNRMPSLSDWASIEKQKAHLDSQEEEAMAKILRLRQQKRLLLEREKKMIAAGLNSLDELDAAEELEKKEKEKEEEKERIEEEAARLAALPTPFGSDPALDLGLDPASFEAFPPGSEMWATLGYDGGTPEVPSSTG
ncbi:hypothetical protein HYALB_00014094 [Hymenoscyphus albidus]|uniref:Uncharacterized protein n=1 Tax=Hymenoscyphus albidus TaxID=595503 RepID=A0A9N9LZU1_9HELO|nr:hypothetical protein HYALB_00014094 [Hymenoscyphus albidus]